MRGNGRHLHTVDLVVAFDHVVEAVLPVHGDFRHACLVQVQKACVSSDHLLDQRRFPVLQDRLKAAEDLLCQGDLSGTGVGLGLLNDVLHPAGALQLVVDVDDPVLHVQVLDGQPAELGDAHAGVEQDVDRFIVFAVYVVIVNELQELAHLVFGDSLPRHAVIDHHPGKLEPEWILLQVVVVDCHLEGGTEHASHCFDTAVSLAISLHLDQEKLRV